ncbi:MAG: hypothetical protein IJW46_07140 [Clostridia bacterium]|nr:hypothetical protein [Clostridia bacterium]
MKIEGVDRLLSYPEFSDVGKLKSLLGLFDQKEELVTMVEEADKAGVNVLIGHENTVGTMNDSTIVFRTIRVDGVDIGAIGIIGPVRMDYEKVIATINTLTESVSEMMRSAKNTLGTAKPLQLEEPKKVPTDTDGTT